MRRRDGLVGKNNHVDARSVELKKFWTNMSLVANEQRVDFLFFSFHPLIDVGNGYCLLLDDGVKHPS